MKVAINTCFGGFWLSEEAEKMYEDLSGHEWGWEEEDRSDPHLIKVIEALGEKASDSHAQIELVEVPDGIEYWIFESNGAETVVEKGHSWGPHAV